MSTTESRTGHENASGDGRYACIEIADETTLIYDVRKHSRWLQSDVAVDLEAIR